jgi:hypothetical protein
LREPVFYVKCTRVHFARATAVIDMVPIVGGVGFPQNGTAYLRYPKKITKNTQTTANSQKTNADKNDT